MRNLEQGTVLFSRYKIVDLIGSGGSSHVYLAENMRIGNLVAIKVVAKKGNREPYSEKAFLSSVIFLRLFLLS